MEANKTKYMISFESARRDKRYKKIKRYCHDKLGSIVFECNYLPSIEVIELDEKSSEKLDMGKFYSPEEIKKFKLKEKIR